MPVALALEGHDVGVVDEAIDEGGGDHRVAEDLAPGLEAAVAGDDDGPVLVAPGDQREEQVRGLALEGQVADLVDDDQAVALDPPQFVVEGVAVLCGFEAVDPLLGGRERDAVSGLAGLDGERDREVAVAGVGRVCDAVLMLWIRCRSGCGWWRRRARCAMSSWRCWGGVLMTVRRC
jgi:hypothetical protein